jgi:hypothetical protein
MEGEENEAQRVAMQCDCRGQVVMVITIEEGFGGWHCQVPKRRLYTYVLLEFT